MNQSMLFSEFSSSPQLIDQLHRYGISKNYKEGDLILDENSSIRSIPIVIKGMLRVIRTEEDGKEILLYYIKAGESCIMSFLGGMHNEKSVVKAEVEEDTEILFLPIDKVSLFIKEYPEWLDYIFKLYHKRFEELLDIINAITFRRVDERLLNLLKIKSENLKSNTVTVTHEQLAKELGTARVVVSRLLKQLQDSGQLKLGRNKIVLSKFP